MEWPLLTAIRLCACAATLLLCTFTVFVAVKLTKVDICVASCVLLQALPRLWPQSFRGCPQPHQNDALLAAALQHFARRCAWDVAADFFACIVKSYAPAVVQLAHALCKLGRCTEALHVRGAQLHHHVHIVALSVALVLRCQLCGMTLLQKTVYSALLAAPHLLLEIRG